MSRSRNIKPGFFRNEVLVTLPFEYRLLFIGLWTMADKAGRMEDRPMKIRMELFPADSVDVDKGLSMLHSAGFIRRYVSEKVRYIQILTWSKHQNPHIKEAASTIPAPCEHGSEPLPNPEFTERAGLIPDSLNLIPDSLKKATVQQAGPCDGFDAFWALYPRKQAKAKAKASWKRIKPEQRDALMAALPIQIEQDDGWRRGFIPLPATYLNGERWTDAITKPTTTGTYNGTYQKLSAVERVEANIDRARRERGEPIEGTARRITS